MMNYSFLTSKGNRVDVMNCRNPKQAYRMACKMHADTWKDNELDRIKYSGDVTGVYAKFKGDTFDLGTFYHSIYKGV